MLTNPCITRWCLHGLRFPKEQLTTLTDAIAPATEKTATAEFDIGPTFGATPLNEVYDIIDNIDLMTSQRGLRSTLQSCENEHALWCPL